MICKYNNGTCLVGGLCDKAGKCHALPSERATPETACPPRSLALATCWASGKSHENSMKTETIKALIALCRAGQCSITLEACQTGVVAKVFSVRGHVSLQTSTYLDANDAASGENLENAIKRVQ